MADDMRWERRFDRRLARATTPRRAAVVIALATTSITVAAGLLMTTIDHKNFPSVGGGLWWAIQTVTTVGYGDHIPETPAGRILAALVMLLGIGFLTVITAAITSSFVAQAHKSHEDVEHDPPATAKQLQSVDAHLDQVDARLERIEAALSARPSAGSG